MKKVKKGFEIKKFLFRSFIINPYPVSNYASMNELLVN